MTSVAAWLWHCHCLLHLLLWLDHVTNLRCRDRGPQRPPGLFQKGNIGMCALNCSLKPTGTTNKSVISGVWHWTWRHHTGQEGTAICPCAPCPSCQLRIFCTPLTGKTLFLAQKGRPRWMVIQDSRNTQSMGARYVHSDEVEHGCCTGKQGKD